MKNLIKFFLLALLYASISLSEAQIYPVQNLQVRGTAQLMGAATFQSTTNIACTSINSYGADPTGVAFSDTAVTAAIAANTSSNICLKALPGLYKFANTISVTLPNSIASISIEGSGEGSTEFYWPTNTTGITVNATNQLNSVHIHNLTLTTGLNGGTNTAVVLNQTGTLAASNNATEQSDFTNVNIRGHDGPNIANYWNTGIVINCFSVINFVNFKLDGPSQGGAYVTVGTGITVAGNVSSGIYAVQYNFVNSNFTNYGLGLLYGTMVQGVQFINSNIVGGNIGVQANGGETGLAELSFTGSQCNVQLYCIFTATSIGNVIVNGSLFYCDKANCIDIYLQSSQGATITGNQFFSLDVAAINMFAIAIAANPANFPIAITGNLFMNFAGTGCAAIDLINTSSLVTLTGNVYANNNTRAINNGSNNFIDNVVPSFTSAGLISPTYPVGISGNKTGTVVSVGSIGEVISNTGSISPTSGVPTNVTSIVLTAGDWDVNSNIIATGAGTTILIAVQGGINTTSATLPSTVLQGEYFTANNSGGGAAVSVHPADRIFTVSVSTTVYLVVQSTFSTSTMNVQGILTARRR